MNELTRAWNLLKPEERPEGWAFEPDAFATHRWIFRTGLGSEDRVRMPDPCIRDTLIVAVGNVNLGLGMSHRMLGGDHEWYYGASGNVKERRVTVDADRLKAANDALEAIRKDDDA